jgi:2'-5' RNA ligase
MKKPYLIEIRIMGDIKETARKLIYDVYNKFHVRGAVKHRPVPHISLFGPFSARSINDVINVIGEVGSEYSELPYQVNGFDYFELKKKFLFITTSVKKNVIYLNIEPSEELQEFRYNLAQKLLKITDSVSIDKDSKKKFQFHATIAMKDIHRKFDVIWDYLKNYEMKSSGMCYRITLVREGKIMYEFDLKTKRLLNRSQAIGKKSRTEYSRTGQSRTGYSRTGQSRTGQSRTGQSRTGYSRTGYSRTGQSRTGHSRTGQSRTDQSRTGQSRTGQSRTDQSRTGQSRTGQSTNERNTSSLKDCYEILEVNENATVEDINRSYKRLSLQWHPDKHIDPIRKKIAEEQMKIINQAKTMIEDAKKF